MVQIPHHYCFLRHRWICIFNNLSFCTGEVKPLQTHQCNAVTFKIGLLCNVRQNPEIQNKTCISYNLEHFSYPSSSFLHLPYLGKVRTHIFWQVFKKLCCTYPKNTKMLPRYFHLKMVIVEFGEKALTGINTQQLLHHVKNILTLRLNMLFCTQPTK